MTDNDGIWAPTLRYHNGTFYLITTAHGCGGNFYMTTKNPAGPWSDPVWLKDAPGIDPSLFFDEDGRCYYTGNRWDFKSAWPCPVCRMDAGAGPPKKMSGRRTKNIGLWPCG